MTTPRLLSKKRIQVGLGLLLAGISASMAFAQPRPYSPYTVEQQALRISKHLKSIPDNEWRTIAGDRISDKYPVAQGDTLYDISKRLFGDAKYWPKIWALNNDRIKNPHVIRPGNFIAFLTGTGTSLPSVAVAVEVTTTSDAQVGIDPASASSPSLNDRDIAANTSEEWKSLPRQRWDLFGQNLILKVPEVGFGFDANDKIRYSNDIAFELNAIAASDPIPSLGQITGSPTPAAHLSLGDIAYVRPSVDGPAMEMDTVYALTVEPTTFETKEENRFGYSYPIVGKIKVTGQKGELFIGKIVAVQNWIPRGAQLIPVPHRIANVAPIPGPRALQAQLLVDSKFSTSTVAQHKQVFINRGSEDGIVPGMIFRAYQDQDPVTGNKLSGNSNYVAAELMVVQASERFSSAIVMRGSGPISEGTKLILMSDAEAIEGTPSARQIDENLDQLDQKQPLREEEERELKQLENWQGNPAATPPASPEAPTDAAPTDPAPTETAPIDAPPTDSTPTDAPPMVEVPNVDDAVTVPKPEPTSEGPVEVTPEIELPPETQTETAPDPVPTTTPMEGIPADAPPEAPEATPESAPTEPAPTAPVPLDLPPAPDGV